MECLEICAICGTTASMSKFSFPASGTDILSLWKNECARSLCDVLFNSEFQSPFLQYFENGKYCSYCLQIILDVNFTWRQLMEFKCKIEKQSTEVYSLLNNNYNNQKRRLEATLPIESISTLSEDLVNNLSSFEILERMYFATLSKLPIEKLAMRDRTQTAGELLEVLIKKEHIDLEIKNEREHVDFDDHFVDGEEDWHSAGETFMNRSSASSIPRIKRKKSKSQFTTRPTKRFLQKQEERKKRQERLQLLVRNKQEDSDVDLDEPRIIDVNLKPPSKKVSSTTTGKGRDMFKKKIHKKYKRPEALVKNANWQSRSIEIPSILTEEENEMLKKKRRAKCKRPVYNNHDESDSDMDFYVRVVKDDDWKPSSKITNKSLIVEKESETLKQKRQDECESDVTDEDLNSEEYLESIVKNINNPESKHLKRNLGTEREEPKKSRRRGIGLQSDIIIEDSERGILKNLIKLQLDKHFRLKRLPEPELTLVKRLSQYSNSSIRKLKLNENHKTVILGLKKRVTDIKRKSKKESKIFFHCTDETCSEKLNTEEELEGHIREKHNGEKLPFHCTTCPKNFKTYGQVKSHRKIIHNGIKLLYYHFCKICQKGYKTEDELKTHSIAHQGTNPFSCAFCDKEFTASADLVRHMNESHVEIPQELSEKIQKLSCDKCGIFYEKESHLQRHLQKHEQDIPPKLPLINCDQCSRSFSSEGSLKFHKELKHTQIVCEICGKSITRNSFPRHELRHTGKLNHECPVCGRRFMSQSQKADHERTHSGIRSFVCSVCGKGFFTKAVLQGHEKIHEPGYIPRKPNRRTKPNRKKKTQEQIPVAESSSGDSSQSNKKSEPFLSPQQAQPVNNYANFPQQHPHNLSYEIIHPPGFVYPL